jgi:hypothetical protein
VRLDHLLSKEHLAAKVVQEPALTECVGGVLNWRRHWLNDRAGNGCDVLVLLDGPCEGMVGCGSEVVVRLVGFLNILLGPEETSAGSRG